MDKKTFAIGIPTINRWDLLEPSLTKYLEYFPNTHICVMDNGHQDIAYKFRRQTPNLTIIENKEPFSVAQSWNSLCRFIFHRCSYSIILNDDVYIPFSEMTVTGLLYRFPDPALYLSQNGFCSFILPSTTWKNIGSFDTDFKGAYFEDKDYERRLKLAKLDIMRNKLLNPVELIESGSISKDPSLNGNFSANHAYYIEKWGGNVGGETFIKPFNK